MKERQSMVASFLNKLSVTEIPIDYPVSAFYTGEILSYPLGATASYQVGSIQPQ